MPVTRIERVLQRLRANGPATVRTLGEVIGASQPTVSRLLRTAGDQIVAIGRASAALRRRSGSAWARPRVAAVSRRLRGPAPSHRDVARVVWGQFYFVADLRVDWLRGEFADGLLPSLPWFMDDMRPQGFLGRAFAHRVAPSLRLPIDLARWTDDDALTALLWRGTDVAGDLVLGDTALDVAMQSVAAPIERDARRAAYARLAEAAMAGDLVGSSAAGEPPKFTACIRDAAGQPQQVIVKFSGPLVGQGVGRRWADLLWAEHVANRVLTDAGVDTAATEVVRVADRCMLQSARFDRVGDSGRTGFVTLAALDDACFGTGRLAGSGWITATDADRIVLCWWFGRLIGNTDMHFGNLGFRLCDPRPFALAPIYDMEPVHYRPAADGSTTRPVYSPPAPRPSSGTSGSAHAYLRKRSGCSCATHPRSPPNSTSWAQLSNVRWPRCKSDTADAAAARGTARQHVRSGDTQARSGRGP